MTKLHILQKEFNEKFGFNEDTLTLSKLKFRGALALEEAYELDSAIRSGIPQDVVDALIDQVYVAYGTLNMLNIDIPKAFKLVHEANMKKFAGEKAGRLKSSSYDVDKPLDWVSPDHRDNIGILNKLLEL